MDSLHLLPSDRVLILNISRCAGVVSQFILGVRGDTQVLCPDPDALVPVHPLLEPTVILHFVAPRLHKILHLHLFKLPHPEDKLPGNHLIPERFSDLGNAKRHLNTRGIEHILIVYKNPLRGFRPQIDTVISILCDGAVMSFKHQVKLPHLGPVESPGVGRVDLLIHDNIIEIFAEPFSGAGTVETFLKFVGLRVIPLGADSQNVLFNQHIGAIPFLRLFVIDHRVVKPLHMTTRLPHLWMHKNSGIDPDDIVVILSHRFPPVALNIPFELYPQRTIIVNGAESAIDFG